ncbi:MAG: hypothetical protein GQ540_03510 [Lutibacter sp.]|uniref:LAGLIDADG family homing endonuclease n=1 Tax=Lutibacter sp. TaxID=1925666 RepID=UPI0019E85EFD|nr:LAGLIDADG family homing endonuclease [Lutibacter sp.]NOR27580.1 hypothetical protein [Lutibacter sp.]
MEENIHSEEAIQNLIDLFGEEEITKVFNEKDFSQYQQDPVGFIKTELNVKYIPDDIVEVCESVRDNKVTVAQSATGTGKAMVNGVSVLTPNGFKNIEDFKIGDEISNTYSGKSNIIGVYPQGKKKSCIIKFNDGSETKCSLDHTWTLEDRISHFKKKDLTVWKLLNHGWKTKDNSVRWRLPKLDKVYMNERKYKLDPYVLGCWLGDGCKNLSIITNIDEEVWNGIEDAGFKLSRYQGQSKRVYGLITKLKELGINDKYSYEKYIPEEYKYGSINQRLELLRGLLDTDGTIDKKNLTSFSSSSYKLASDVRFLIRSLGGFVKSISTKKTTHRDHYLVHFSLFCKEKIFKIKRKEERRKKQTENKFGGRKYITDIKYLGEEECTCIMVDSDDNLFIVEDSFIPTHNTFVAAALAIWHYKCFPESQTVVTAAPPEENIKSKLWSELVSFVLKNRRIFKKDKILTLKLTDDINLSKIHDSDDVEVESGKHFIMGKPISSTGSVEERESKFSGQHADWLLFLLDEGDAIPDEVFRGIDGCMSSDGARILIMYNPKRRGGHAYNLIRKGLANVVTLSAFNHPNVTSGENLIPGAVSRDKVIERIHEWTEPLREDEEPDASCFEIPDFLVGAIGIGGSGKEYPPLKKETRRIVDQQFAYKILGIYPTQSSNQLISEAWIDNAVTRWKLYVAQYGENPQDNVRGVFGMDVADEGDDSCCVCKKYGNFVKGFDRWRGIDTDLSATRLSKIYANDEPIQANVECDGIGAAIPPKIRRNHYLKCVGCGKTYFNVKHVKCPVCEEKIRQSGDESREHLSSVLEMKHFNIKKVVVSTPSKHKCDHGRFDKLRDELWWAVKDWLEKDQSAMIPDIPELREELLVMEFFESPQNGKIKVTDKKKIRQKLGRSSDTADSLIQCFYNHFGNPRVRNLL